MGNLHWLGSYFILFYFLIVTIAFKPIESAYDGCSYHQAKTPIDFWYRRDLNPKLLLTCYC